MNDDPRKLGKNDSRKSKIIDLDDLKDKAITIKDKNKDKIKGKSLGTIKGKSLNTSRKEYPSKLGKENERNISKSFSDKLSGIPFINDARIILIVILIILIGVVGVWAANSFQATANETNTTTNIQLEPPKNHFNNGLISFDYPEGWNVTNGTKAPLVVTVSKDENNSFVVMNEDLNNTTFTERVLLWRQNILQSGDITYESNITIDNSKGYNIEFTRKMNNSTFNARGVAVSKNETIYFVMFIFNQSLLDYKDEMDLVINSFHILH
ncbi:MAG TPA: hypothetical protein VGC02_01915 [Methanobacterium sp.]